MTKLKLPDNKKWQEQNLRLDCDGRVVQIRKNCFNGNGLTMLPSFDTFDECFDDCNTQWKELMIPLLGKLTNPNTDSIEFIHLCNDADKFIYQLRKSK